MCRRLLYRRPRGDNIEAWAADDPRQPPPALISLPGRRSCTRNGSACPGVCSDMAERVELGSLGSKAEHLLDLALRAASNGRTADSARPAASAARYFHHADGSVRTVRAEAEHLLDRALNAAAHGHIAATPRLAADVVVSASQDGQEMHHGRSCEGVINQTKRTFSSLRKPTPRAR